jgi:phytoene dehydrogenase-like protein
MQYEKGGYMAKLVPKMAKGGETNANRERMYNFLKDDLVILQKSIEENNQEEIDKFFSYWNHHLNSLEPKMGSKRMYNFLKDDLVGLEAATKELPSSKEETDRFFSYWNTHLKSLSDEDLMNMMQYFAGGGVGRIKFQDKVDSISDRLAGGMMAKGGEVTFDDKVKAISKKLEGKPVPVPYRKEYGSRYDKEDAQEAARRIVGNMRKLYGE